MAGPVSFVTSMTRGIHDAAGHAMLNSWLTNVPAPVGLTVYTEGGEDAEAAVMAHNGGRSRRIRTVPIDRHPWLTRWLAENAHNVPVKRGGAATRPMSMWNDKASLWFRKAVAIVDAYRSMPRDGVMAWVDADVLVTGWVRPGLLQKVMDGAHIAYVCGADRKRRMGIETGLLLLRRCPEVDAVVDEYVTLYDSAAKGWDALERWDDGFVLRVVLERMTAEGSDFWAADGVHELRSGALCRDLCTRDSPDPMTCTSLASTFVHLKGLHRSLGVDGGGGEKKGKRRERSERYARLIEEFRSDPPRCVARQPQSGEEEKEKEKEKEGGDAGPCSGSVTVPVAGGGGREQQQQQQEKPQVRGGADWHETAKRAIQMTSPLLPRVKPGKFCKPPLSATKVRRLTKPGTPPIGPPGMPPPVFVLGMNSKPTKRLFMQNFKPSFTPNESQDAASVRSVDPEKVYIIHGIMRGLGNMLRLCVSAGAPYIYVDNAYFPNSRYHMFSLTVNGMQDTSFPPAQPYDNLSRSDRVLRGIPPLWPTTKGGDEGGTGTGTGTTVLVCPASQISGDFLGCHGWLEDTVRAIRRRNTALRIVVRPKAVLRAASPDTIARLNDRYGDVSLSTSSLYDDLRSCVCACVHNSRVAVEAVVHWVPVYATPESIAHPLSQTEDGITAPAPYDPDTRRQWLEHVARGQFSPAEMRTGFALDALRPKIEAARRAVPECPIII